MRIVIHPEGDPDGADAVAEQLRDWDWDDDPVTIEVAADE